jgi:3-deoxy-7-phosphoheptulonate synthase
MVEMHPDPRHALSDGSQALEPDQFASLMDDLRGLAAFAGVRF